MDQSIDSTQFRQVLSHFASGVTVVTARNQEGEQHGMTCSAFMSISTSPPLVSICLTAATRTERMVRDGGAFVVNVLAADQALIAERFAGRHKDKESNRFEGIAWQAGKTSTPILQGVNASLECQVEHAVTAGDHTIFVGRVIDAAYDRQAIPLVYYRSGFVSLAAPT